MSDTKPGAIAPSSPLRAVLVRSRWRVIVALLTSVSGASLLALLASLLLFDEGPHNPLQLIRLVAALCILPSVCVTCLRWAFAGMVTVTAGALVIEQRHQRIEIPLASIAAVEPWTVPTPGSGLWLRLRSGRRWPDGIQMDDPAALIERLVDAGAPASIGREAKRFGMVYARAKSRGPSRSVRRVLWKFPIFALVPTLPLFRVHQLIAYGGVLGEYYQYGLKAYLLGFAIYWATLTIYLMLYAAALRAPLEVLAMAVTALAPERAAGARSVLERTAAVLYYGAVPAMTALRFVPW